MDRSKNIELIKKLQALAERGVGGEKETATRKIALLIEKYGISELELDESEVKSHRIKYHNQREKKLLSQLIYARGLMDNVYCPAFGKGLKSELILKTTDAEAMQIIVEFDFYRQLFEEEEEFLYACFLHKHNIFPPNAKAARTDYNTARRMALMMATLQERSFTERIGMEEE